MPTATTTANRPARDPWVVAGIAVTAVTAAVASFTGLRGLAADAGWPTRLAWLLPVTLDTYASTTRSRRARRFARANAVGAIAASIAGNATYHAAALGLVRIRCLLGLFAGTGLRLVLAVNESPKRVKVRRESEDGGRYGADEDDDGPRDRDEAGGCEVVAGVAHDARGDGADRIGPGEAAGSATAERSCEPHPS